MCEKTKAEDTENDEKDKSNDGETEKTPAAEPPHSYYDDDAHGYEIYRPDDDDDDE